MKELSTLENSTFCVLPWLQVGVRPSGRVRICPWIRAVLHDEQGKPLNVAQADWSRLLASSDLEKIKHKMLRGERVEACVRCYDLEATGNQSKRLVELRAHQESIAQVLEGQVTQPQILELRLGNKCNLGCISCSPDSSSFLFQEFENNQASHQQYHKSFVGSYQTMKANQTPWFERDEFWAGVIALLPGLRRLYIAGGEPTLIKQNWQMLNEAVDRGEASHILLEMSTNLTVITESQIDLLNRFQRAQVYCSFDGVGETFEYLRFPAKWSRVEENFRRLLRGAGPSLHISITPTISALSIWRLKDLYRWTELIAEEIGVRVPVDCHTLLRDPDYQSLRNLPANLKRRALDEIEALLEHYTDGYDQAQLGRVWRFIKHSAGEPELMRAGRPFIENFDRIRGRSWQSAIPEMKEIWT
ncbi:MAG: radical SAM protein [Bdellovibrionales bacterium]|nr:radical SAM protein [Bdellovibrionales bacterium]